MRKFGLIGKTLKHSFSQKYFTEKFEKERIENCQYDLFELPDISHFQELVQDPKGELSGLNVTIPYKKVVMPFLNELDPLAQRIDAVNVIKISDGHLKGFNSDYYGFRQSLESWLKTTDLSALILGTGGASNAVQAVLEDLLIPFRFVSRSAKPRAFTYEQINSSPNILANHQLIINCSPVGTFPNIDEKPDLPYASITENHYLYDLVYNPEETAFMKEGAACGAATKNGADMLRLQAEKSWEIWNS